MLARIVAAVGQCRLARSRESVFLYLVRAILYQQISGHAARAIQKRLQERFGERLRPEDLRDADESLLRAAGLSRQKTGYLRDLAAKASDGLPLERVSHMSEARVVETVTSVKGIGRWTADMLMMFRLGRPDVLPVGDYGIQKAMQRAYRMRALPKPARMVRVAAP